MRYSCSAAITSDHDDLISDQFAFRPTESTSCALVYFMHHDVTRMHAGILHMNLFRACMLETNSYVRCLHVDVSKAFDVVDQVVS